VSWGFCYIAQQGEPGAIFRRIVDRLAVVGVVLRNPQTNHITTLDDEGNQQEVTELDLMTAASRRPRLAIQLWLAADADVVCGFRRLANGLVCHAYSMKGFTPAEAETFVQWSLEYFRLEAAVHLARWLVVDPRGRTEDVDWDEVVLGRADIPIRLPMALGVPRDRLSGLTLPATWETVSLDGVMLVGERSVLNAPSVSPPGSGADE
jgi:hypothetical protein